MTDQMSDQIINECAGVDFDDLRPYGIMRASAERIRKQGEPSPFKSSASPSKEEYASHLSRGYVSVYKLTIKGQLILESYKYALQKNRKPEFVNELIEGNFFLIMKTSFAGSETYVPVGNGRIVPDQNEWITEKE